MKTKRYDVAVCGAGVAGCAAAVAAARLGMKTVLIEKQCLLGGLATGGLIYIYLPLCDGFGKKVIGGISEEMIRRCMEYGPFDLPPRWGGPADGDPGIFPERYQCCFSPAGFCLTLDKMLLEAGVELQLDTMAVETRVEDGKVSGIVAADSSGMFGIEAECFVDATGGAEIAMQAGCGVHRETNYVTPWFIEASEKRKAFHLTGDLNVHCLGALKEKFRADECCREGSTTDFVRRSWRMIRAYYDGFTAEERKKNYPVHLPTMPQFRKIAGIDSLYDLHDGDISADFPDSVGIAPDWRTPTPVWETPYRTLLPRNVKGLIAAGRNIGTTGEAWEVYRVIPTAAMTGEAAGTAAALAVSEGVELRDVNIGLLQERLRRQGGIVFRSEIEKAENQSLTRRKLI